MKNDKIYGTILSAHIITRITEQFASELNLDSEDKCIGIMTSDMDDLLFIGADEATKKANVKVVYAKEFYGGPACPASKLQGDGMIMLAGPNVSEVRAGMNVIKAMEEQQSVYAYSANDDDTITYISHVVSGVGTYFANEYNIPPGSSLAYCTAPPTESCYATDTAAKATNAKLVKFFGPPTEDNYGGAMFSGTQSDCETACAAFARAVQEIADNPIMY
jgi:ethanolamine utilization protein EutL